MIQPRHMRDALQQVQRRAGPIAQIAHGQITVSEETGQQYLPAAAIETALTAAGYRVEYQDAERGAWCRISLDNAMVAQGFDGPNHADDGSVIKGTRRRKALLQAVRGAAREEALYAQVDAALTDAGYTVDSDLRDHLVVGLHREGPGRLAAALNAMKKAKAKAAAGG